jgi:hypothetical protein
MGLLLAWEQPCVTLSAVYNVSVVHDVVVFCIYMMYYCRPHVHDIVMSTAYI